MHALRDAVRAELSRTQLSVSVSNVASVTLTVRVYGIKAQNNSRIKVEMPMCVVQNINNQFKFAVER